MNTRQTDHMRFDQSLKRTLRSSFYQVDITFNIHCVKELRSVKVNAFNTEYDRKAFLLND